MGNDLLTGFLAGQSDSGNSGGNNGGFFGNEGLWAVIILAIIFGWGRNGSGFGPGSGDNSSGGGNNVTYVPYPAMGFGGGCSCSGGGGAVTRADLCSEFNFNNLDSAVRGVQSGLCDGFYAVNTSLLNGFNGVNSAVCNLGYNMQQGFNGTQMTMMQGQNALSTQLANCCCENREGQADIKYQMATDTCAVQTAIQNAARDIIDNQNANYRGLMDFMVQDKLAAKDARIAALENEVSQANQNAVIGARIDAAVAEILRRTSGCNSGCGSCC